MFAAVMLTRPAGHEAKAEARKSEAKAPKFFRGRGHNVWGEDLDVGVQNIVFSKPAVHNRNDCRLTNYELLRWLVETPSRDFAHYRLSGGRPDML